MINQDLYLEYLNRLITLSDDTLIDRFNREAGGTGWKNRRSAYHAAIHSEFIRRGFDFSLIGNRRKLCYRSRIQLIDNKLVPWWPMDN